MKSCPTLCNFLQQTRFLYPPLSPRFAQIHVHWVGDAISPSCPLQLSSPFAFNLFQHQGLFQPVGSSHQVAKVLELQLQHQSLQWMFRVDFLLDWLVWSLLSKGLSRVFSSTTVGKNQFFDAQPSLWSNSYIHRVEQFWLHTESVYFTLTFVFHHLKMLPIAWNVQDSPFLKTHL